MIETKWRDQCQAARGIREHFGIEKALGYLIGEKLTGFLSTADRIPEFAAELPAFVAEVKTIFEPTELREYLGRARRRRVAGVRDDDLVYTATDAPLIARMKHLLLNA